MSVDNLFNNPVKKAKQKSLTQLFDKTINNIRSMELGDEGDAIAKILVKHYAERRKEIEAEIDLDADISHRVVQRRNKKKTDAPEETTNNDSQKPAPAPASTATSPAKVPSKAEQLKANAKKKQEDDLSA